MRLIKSHGDIEKDFREAEYVREDTFRTAPQGQAALEVHGSISHWDIDGSLTHWCSHQAPFGLQRGLAKMVGLEGDRVRVIVPTIGGGFGGKVAMFPHDIISAHLSRITGKPVKLMLSREEVFHATTQRHPMIVTLRSGLRRDGTLICQSVKIIADGGAYAGTGSMAMNVAHHHLLLPYRLQSYSFDGIRAITNKPIGGPYQGHGGPQIGFATECQLDMIARDLHIDPIEIARKNFVYAGYDNPGKMSIHSCGLQQCADFVEKSLGWREKKGKLPEGRGLGASFSGGPSSIVVMPHSPTGINLQVNLDGGVNIFSGGADIGQGMDTVVCQSVAQELGLSMEDVRLTRADTAITPYDKGSYGTGGALRLGNAAVLAAREVKKKLIEIIALKFETRPEDIEFGKGKVFVRDNYDRGIDFREAIKIYRYSGKPMPLTALGSYEPDVDDFNTLIRKGGNYSPTYSFLGTGFEVEVDKETGQVKILKAAIANDLGRVINRMGQEGQLEGALSKGIGMALYEDLPHENGKYKNGSFADYPILTSLDEPAEIDWENVETIDPVGPFGAKSSAEGAPGPITPAIINAIEDATGVRITDLPVTPDKIKKALERKGGKA